MDCVGMIGVDAASGLKSGKSPTEFSPKVSAVFREDLFSSGIPLAGDEVETPRLLLSDEADDESEEEEFLLRRLVFEFPVCLGLLLERVSAGSRPCLVVEGVEGRTWFAGNRIFLIWNYYK